MDAQDDAQDDAKNPLNLLTAVCQRFQRLADVQAAAEEKITVPVGDPQRIREDIAFYQGLVERDQATQLKYQARLVEVRQSHAQAAALLAACPSPPPEATALLERYRQDMERLEQQVQDHYPALVTYNGRVLKALRQALDDCDPTE